MRLTKMIVIAVCTVLYLTTAAHADDGNDQGDNNNNQGGYHAPEVDAGMASGALALLGNALLLLHERRRRQ